MSVQLFRPSYSVEECVSEIRKVLDSGWTGQGPRCAEFEKKWCEFTGARHAHFVSSATAALHIAVRLLDLPKGSVIATTPLTFVSTNAAILYEGHIPHFCDCGKDLSLNAKSVIDAVTNHGAKAVMWVHHGGNVSRDFYDFMDWVKKSGLDVKVIEDCAHASGAFYLDGTRVGSRTDTCAAFSFHSVKNLPIFDGGMICVPDDKGDVRARRLSWLGIDKSTYARTASAGNETYKWSYDVPELGWKYNGNDVAAAIGLVQLRHLDRDNAYRGWLYELYGKKLPGLVKHGFGSSHHLVVAEVENRDGVIASLKANGYAPGVHYLPNYHFPVFSGFDHGDCRGVEELSRHIVSLPNHLELTIGDVERICQVIVNA